MDPALLEESLDSTSIEEHSTSNDSIFSSDSSLPILTRGVLPLDEVIPPLEPNSDELLKHMYQTIIGFVEGGTNQISGELLEAINVIDPYFVMEQEQQIIDKANQLYGQLPKSEDKVDDDFMEQFSFDQKEGFYRALPAVTNMTMVPILKGEFIDYNITLCVACNLPEVSQIVDAITEALMELDDSEKRKLRSTRTNIFVHNALGTKVEQQSTWQFDQVRNLHTGDIFLTSSRNELSMPGYIKKTKGEEEEGKAIVKHEFGHILHAILNPANFRLSSVLDSMHNTHRSSESLDQILDARGDQNSYRWYYAAMHESVREFVAETFTALTSGAPISDEQYNWYLKHGGPRVARRNNGQNGTFQVMKK
ncbi:MAG: hypothetical protein HFI34_12110 [Lachnospiraceae bacterium]|nr:hypothetical protein [Lachnospiraceae bacterium]